MLKKLLGKRKSTPAAAHAAPAADTGPEQAQLSAADLVLRLRHQDFVSALREHGVPKAQLPYTRPLCGELIVTYAFDTPGQFIAATPPLLQEAGVAQEQVHEIALQNTARQVNEASVRIIHDAGGCLLRVGEAGTFTNLEAACLLYPGALKLLHQELQPAGQMLLCTPTRNYLFALDSARPESHAKALEAVRMMYDDDPQHQLSLQWMVQEDGGWQVAQPN